MDITFAPSAFPPLALGFFGLGTGYLIWGPQELAGWPRRDDRVDRSLGVWGIWMPGLCQFVAGVILFVGLTWFEVFTHPVLYMAALAFSVYGIHWFAIGWNRYRGNDPRPNAGLCVAFMVVSALGATVFFAAADWPVGLVFLGLFAVYFSEFFVSVGVGLAERALGLFRIATGLWLMYLTYAVTVDFALGYHWRT
ncbi:hypothetical protein GCM10018793_63680 [Streptomyces sulfonofaciens]|uniref:Uncharacterized protein n=1 Tax=Streptomyces sulfonofaciens TaxID=68272 RepID=A0A919GMZ5_9ACTN|nr:hypothetical protein [Streptomyces sulfonofaciens]GHH87532.1 hypothetical protein GCM10018793_63680 [Streptomyces sulfonofaciens]